MAGAGITQSICLPLLSVYQLSTNGTGQVSAQDIASCSSQVTGAHRAALSSLSQFPGSADTFHSSNWATKRLCCPEWVPFCGINPEPLCHLS